MVELRRCLPNYPGTDRDGNIRAPIYRAQLKRPLFPRFDTQPSLSGLFESELRAPPQYWRLLGRGRTAAAIRDIHNRHHIAVYLPWATELPSHHLCPRGLLRRCRAMVQVESGESQKICAEVYPPITNMWALGKGGREFWDRHQPCDLLMTRGSVSWAAGNTRH